jgi:hypothetical protein
MVQPTGTALSYSGNLSSGTAPSGTNQTVNYGKLDPLAPYQYDGYTPGQLPADVPSWGPSGPPPDGGHPASRVDQARWIGSAVQILVEHGVDPSHIDTGRIAELVNQGSGGNPHAVNLNDPSAQNGYPPKGLLQLTDPVFEQHQLPGYGNIWQPVDNLVAGIVFRMALLNQVQQGSSRPAR